MYNNNNNTNNTNTNTDYNSAITPLNEDLVLTPL